MEQRTRKNKRLETGRNPILVPKKKVTISRSWKQGGETLIMVTGVTGNPNTLAEMKSNVPVSLCLF